MKPPEFDRRVRDAETLISDLIRERKIVKLSDKERIKFVDFYLKQANLSLLAADLLFNISTQKESKNFHKINPNYECFLWVINSSYYTLFYAVQALLAFKNIRILSVVGIHKTIAHAFVYFCIKNDFVAKKLYEQFLESQLEAAELLNLDEFREKAQNLAFTYFYEAEKRAKFTYETEEGVKQRHAKTSLDRAKEFLGEIEVIIK